MTLAAYITSNFPTIKTQLGWTDSIDILLIVGNALELYGDSDESTATDLQKLHALADVAVWRRAQNDISLDYQFSADNASFSRQQAVDAVRKNLAEAESKAIVYLPGYGMTVQASDRNPDWVT